MARAPIEFFPPRLQRPVLGTVLTEFPFPLALTYARLHDGMDAQEPVAAAWLLRDAFECLVKFVASVAVADFLHAGPHAARAATIAGILLKPQGLSLGDWHSVLEEALRPLEIDACTNGTGAGRRLLPELFGVFFAPRGPDRTPLNQRINGDEGSFVAWRNRVFGHGVFQQDRQWYAAETMGWLPWRGRSGSRAEHCRIGADTATPSSATRGCWLCSNPWQSGNETQKGGRLLWRWLPP